MTVFIRYFSAIFFVTYIVVAFVVPSVRTYRATGINPITFGNSDNAHDLAGRWFKIILGLIPFVILLYWTGNNYYHYSLPASYMVHPSIQWTGIALCILSFIWTAAAQWQMGNAWRIGIDEVNRTALVTKGIFALSRNPVFLGMIVTLLGFFLMPNAITLLVLVAGYLLIQIQIRLEEEFLTRQHGKEYKEYRKRVRRLL